jgi:hypothetical protein
MDYDRRPRAWAELARDPDMWLLAVAAAAVLLMITGVI